MNADITYYVGTEAGTIQCVQICERDPIVQMYTTLIVTALVNTTLNCLNMQTWKFVTSQVNDYDSKLNVNLLLVRRTGVCVQVTNSK